MSNVLLQKYCNRLDKRELIDFDYNFDIFNKQENFILFDYQVEALENMALLLKRFFNNNGESEVRKFYQNNLSSEMIEELSIEKESELFEILNKNNFSKNNHQIDFFNFINRACFWMATGSGKSVIIVKLIELLYNFMKQNIIPDKHILIVAPNDKLIKQIQDHIDIFNQCNSKSHSIYMKNLDEFEKNKFAGIKPLAPNSLEIFYTRSTLISDENKENEFDYKTYILNEGWYLILDEAHKGDQNVSKRKAYLNVLAQNGFIFNFSATFTDLLDEITTIYNFNLAEFIKKGYGKNIKVLDDEFKYFKANNKKEKEDNLSDNDKIKIILKSFIVFTVIKKVKNDINDLVDEYDLSFNYHNPLMVTISNEINTKEADMKLYFKYIAKLAKKEIKNELLNDVKKEIVNNLKDSFQYIVGEDLLSNKIIDKVNNITKQDILENVFYSKSPSEIEVIEIKGTTDELVFKLKLADQPFALINASDRKKWKKNTLDGYVFSKDVSESKFEELKDNDNTLNLLMGSRMFIEGWDTNRPNIMNFINMGVSDENTKLILQAIGRGVRIEPRKNLRKRLEKSNEFINYDFQKQNKLSDLTSIIETLFIFATNKQIIKNIVEGIDKDKENWVKVDGIKKSKITKDLIVPVYEELNKNNRSIDISKQDYQTLNKYVNDNSDKLLLVRDNCNLDIINKIKNKDKINLKDEEPNFNENPKALYRTIDKHFNTKVKELVGYRKEKKIDIAHYNKIKINISEDESRKEELVNLEKVLKKKVKDDYSKEQLDIIGTIKEIGREVVSKKNPMTNAIKEQAEQYNIEIDKVFENFSKKELKTQYQIELKNIEQHYYNPLILSKDNSKYKHIITVKSEIEFLEKLEEYLANNKDDINFDWWYFSKIDESIDTIHIPYFDSKEQKYSKFFPDFIFWMKKGEDYYIRFVDPKGLTRERNPKDKIEGYENIFLKEDKSYNGLKVETDLFYYNKDSSNDDILENYRIYDLSKVFEL